MRMKKPGKKLVNNHLGVAEKESDFDSNYQSSDKSSPESPRPFSSADIGSSTGSATPGVKRDSSWSGSDSETSPASAKSDSPKYYSSTNRVSLEIGGQFPKIYHIPINESRGVTPGQECILEEAMTHEVAREEKEGPEKVMMSLEEAERERASLQRTTEKCSLLALIPALCMLAICPWFMLPIFTVPNPHTEAFKIAILAGTPLALFFLLMGCLMGNIIWYFDEHTGKMRWFVNCGGKIKDHYWGHELFNGFPAKSKTVQEV